MKIPFVTNSPIRKNLLANFFGIGVQLMNQIVLVPFYILFWGNELYSDWIVLSALTTIFSMSDVGLNNVIQNRFAICHSEGKKKECDSLLTNNFVLVFGSLVLFVFLSFVFCFIWDISKVMDIHQLTRWQASLVFIILIVRVFLGMMSGVASAIYKGTHNASRAIIIDNLCLLAVAIISLICMMLSVSIVLMSIVICIPYFVVLIYKQIDSRKFYDYKFSLKTFDWPLLKSILLPSLSFMSFPLGNTIVLQGYTLLVNSFFGADSVVLYNTTRTLCNFIKTFLATLQTAVWPEYSIAYGNCDYSLMRYLHRKIIKVTLIISICMGLGLLATGPFIYEIWTHGAVQFEYALMTSYIIVLIIESLWTSSSVTLMATNNHSTLGVIYIISAAISIALALVVAYLESELWLIASTLIVMNVVVGFYAISAGFRLTKDKCSIFA